MESILRTIELCQKNSSLSMYSVPTVNGSHFSFLVHVTFFVDKVGSVVYTFLINSDHLALKSRRKTSTHMHKRSDLVINCALASDAGLEFYIVMIPY